MAVTVGPPGAGLRIATREFRPGGSGARRRVIRPFSDLAGWPAQGPSDMTPADPFWSIWSRQGSSSPYARVGCQRQEDGPVAQCQMRVRQSVDHLRAALNEKSSVAEAAETLRRELLDLERQAAAAGLENLASVAMMLQYVLYSESFELLEPQEWAGYFEAAKEALHSTPRLANTRLCSQVLRRSGLSWVATRSDPRVERAPAITETAHD